MKKFKYRLEVLLKMKEQIEKDKQKQLAVSLTKLYNQEEYLESIGTKRENSFEIQRKGMEQTFSVAEMLVVSRYLHRLKRDKVMGEELLKALKRDKEKKREELLEAARERKKYGKLKECQAEKYNKKIEDALTKEIDEIAINNYRYKKRNTNRN